MSKSISNLGTILSKSEQRTVNGGRKNCPPGQVLKCTVFAPGYVRCFCQPRDASDM